MKKFLPLLFLILLQIIPIIGLTQDFEAVKTIGNTLEDKNSKIAHDSDGNVYMIGFISKGTGKTYFGQISDNSYGNFLAKFNKYGQKIWIKADSANFFEPKYKDLAVGPDGSIYITGSIYLSRFVLDKYDKDGNLLWKKRIRSDPFGYDYVGEAITVDQQGNVYVVGKFDGKYLDGIVYPKEIDTDERVSNDFIVKYNEQGEILWAQSNFHRYLTYTKIAVDGAGNTISTGYLEGKTAFGEFELESIPSTVENYGGALVFMVKRDPTGHVLWAKGLPVGWHDFAIDGQDNICFSALLASYKYPDLKSIEGFPIPKPFGTVLLKLDPSGKAMWLHHYTGNSIPKVAVTENAIYEHGSFYKQIIGQDTLVASGLYDNFLTKYDFNGKKVWTKQYGGPDSDGAGNIIYLPAQKKLVLTGSFRKEMIAGDQSIRSRGGSDLFLIHFSEIPLLRSPVIKGKIFADNNANCHPDSEEAGLPGVFVLAQPGPFIGMTDSLGNYSIEADTGSFIISQVIPAKKNTLVRPTCPDLQGVQVRAPEFNKTITDINFGNQVSYCALLSVDIAADRRRRCMRSKTTVTYTNDGTVDAQNVQIKVLYPRFVVPIKSSLPWAARQDSVLLFDIGTLKAGERRSFVITDSTICGNESIRGLSQCVKAIITPKNTCISPSPDWDQSSVAVEAQLTDEDQTASFTIANEGEGDMSDSTAYRVYANEALVEEGSVKLAKGEKASLQVPMSAATLRVEADQSANHPGKSRPTASVQPPAVAPSMAAPTPVDAFYQDDADAEVSISCLNIIDSFDPNDKQVMPQGITRRHYIKAEDELQYQIRFQNTGTDTAYTVVVKDTLSAFVDVASLQIGSVSHPFTYTVSGKGRPVLTFTFKNINLPDHKTNEPASHGYVRFRISQAPGNAKGTVIKNLAYNYFDYNSPIATNEVFNIIGDTIIAPVVPVVVYDCGKALPTTAQAGADVHLCETNEAVLQANTPVQGLGRWRILSGQATLSDATNPQATLSEIGYGEVVLEWSITLCERVSRSQVKVYRYAIPAAPAISAPPLQCEGSQLMPLTATGSNITWYADADKQQKLHAGASYTPQVSVTTTFYATQTVNGCEGPAAAAELRIHPAKVSFVVRGDTLIAPQADSYQWYFNGQEIKGATRQKYFVKNTGAYRLKTITNGCAAFSDPADLVINLPHASLKLGPNPATDKMKLELAANETGMVSIIIWDQLGRKAGSLMSRKEWTVLEQSLDLGKLKPGLYLLEVRLGKEALTRKFVKQ